LAVFLIFLKKFAGISQKILQIRSKYSIISMLIVALYCATA